MNVMDESNGQEVRKKGTREQQSYGLKDGLLHMQLIQQICSCSKIRQNGHPKTAGVCLVH